MDVLAFFSFISGSELTLPVLLVRIFLSFIAGFVIGFERKVHLQDAGLRTHILICIGSCVLMLISLYVPRLYAPGRGDPSRIAAQIVSGIGFLGGGAILHQGLNIRGLNSAATVWVASALGMAIGCGMVVVASCTLVLCVLIMFLLERFEARYFPAERLKKLELIFKNDKVNFALLQKELRDRGLIITNIDFSKELDEKQIKIIYTVKVPLDLDIVNLTEGLKYIGHLGKIKMID